MSDKQAFPLWEIGEANELGLTRRELFAAMAMQGMAADPVFNNQMPNDIVAKMCVDLADALIAELDKK